MIYSTYITKAPIGDLDQDSSEEEAVQDMICRTFECRLDNHNHYSGDSKVAGYDTDDSLDVTQRRWPRNKGGRSKMRRGESKKSPRQPAKRAVAFGKRR
jgi:hypothetical protein